MALVIRLLLIPVVVSVALALASAWMAARRTRAELDARSTELADPALHPLLARLAAAVGVERLRVHLYEVPAVNGLAAPDGRVFLTRGFYDRYRRGDVTAEEIAGVVAHEVGHVALGHARRRLIDFTGQTAARTGLMLALGRVLPVVGPWLAHAALTLLAAGLSRRDEREADAYATALLIKAGIGAGPQVSLLRKLGALAGRRGAEPPAWLSTHPRVDERIAAIEANAARWLAAGATPSPRSGPPPGG